MDPNSFIKNNRYLKGEANGLAAQLTKAFIQPEKRVLGIKAPNWFSLGIADEEAKKFVQKLSSSTQKEKPIKLSVDNKRLFCVQFDDNAFEPEIHKYIEELKSSFEQFKIKTENTKEALPTLSEEERKKLEDSLLEGGVSSAETKKKSSKADKNPAAQNKLKQNKKTAEQKAAEAEAARRKEQSDNARKKAEEKRQTAALAKKAEYERLLAAAREAQEQEQRRAELALMGEFEQEATAAPAPAVSNVAPEAVENREERVEAIATAEFATDLIATTESLKKEAPTDTQITNLNTSTGFMAQEISHEDWVKRIETTCNENLRELEQKRQSERQQNPLLKTPQLIPTGVVGVSTMVPAVVMVPTVVMVPAIVPTVLYAQTPPEEFSPTEADSLTQQTKKTRG